MHQSLILRIHSKYTPGPVIGYEADAAFFDRANRWRRERLDVDEPLIGQQRLQYGIAAIAARHHELVGLDALDEVQGLEICTMRVRAAPRSSPR